jgi:hypothetical protein
MQRGSVQINDILILKMYFSISFRFTVGIGVQFSIVIDICIVSTH